MLKKQNHTTSKRGKMSLSFLTMCICVIFASSARAQSYSIEKEAVFVPENKKILLLRDSAHAENRVILFKTDLAVNTDGAPTSYHPQDPQGQTKAMNTVCNAIAVRRVGQPENLCMFKATKLEAINVFEKWRDSGYLITPAGYRITWNNVLAGTKDSAGNIVPCIFRNSGRYNGYFGSLKKQRQTGCLPDSRGECEVKDQLNSLEIPHLVMVKGENPLKAFGAKVGDLVVAYNPATNKTSFAVVGDVGPERNLGEGSVKMNMTLSGRTVPPKTRDETNRFFTVKKVVVAIIPSSVLISIAKPYTVENITEAVSKWQREAGFNTPEKFIAMMKSFQSKL